MINSLSRRAMLRQTAVAGFGALTGSFSADMAPQSILTRQIPSSGERLPVVGLGSWQQFDVGPSDSDRRSLRDVLTLMHKQGGQLIDASPMYGRAEEVIGDLTTDLALTDNFFLATKVWTTGKQAGIDQMHTSLRRMRRKTLDLIQIHNLLDWQTQLKTLKEWKQAGTIRYIGITHYTASAHDQLERIVKSEPIDFVQMNYSIRVRNAERTLLPSARDKGVAVLVNEPFESGSLFRLVNGKPLPTWSSEYGIQSWGQFFLKFILANPAVTCVIPGTSDPKHLIDNLGAGSGRLPDGKVQAQMAAYLASL